MSALPALAMDQRLAVRPGERHQTDIRGDQPWNVCRSHYRFDRRLHLLSDSPDHGESYVGRDVDLHRLSLGVKQKTFDAPLGAEIEVLENPLILLGLLLVNWRIRLG